MPRMTAFSPGQSPPLVRMPIFMLLPSHVRDGEVGDAARIDTSADGQRAPFAPEPGAGAGRRSRAPERGSGAERLAQQVHERTELHGLARRGLERLAVQGTGREPLLLVDELGDLRVDRVRGDDAP